MGQTLPKFSMIAIRHAKVCILAVIAILACALLHDATQLCNHPRQLADTKEKSSNVGETHPKPTAKLMENFLPKRTTEPKDHSDESNHDQGNNTSAHECGLGTKDEGISIHPSVIEFMEKDPPKRITEPSPRKDHSDESNHDTDLKRPLTNTVDKFCNWVGSTAKAAKDYCGTTAKAAKDYWQKNKLKVLFGTLMGIKLATKALPIINKLVTPSDPPLDYMRDLRKCEGPSRHRSFFDNYKLELQQDPTLKCDGNPVSWREWYPHNEELRVCTNSNGHSILLDGYN